MKNRNRRPPRAAETAAVSDSSKLVWHQFIQPAQAARAQLDAALIASQEIAVRHMMHRDGVDPEAGWKFNATTMQYERHPNSG